jgi:hypothetical protein
MTNHYLLIALIVIFLSGCGSTAIKEAEVKQAIIEAQAKNMNGAALDVIKKLKPDGKNSFLYHLESGTLNYLAGNYEKSQHDFDQANKISERLQTISLSNQFVGLMSNPRMTNYSGTKFEKLYINYYRALNSLMLAMKASKYQKKRLLDEAVVDARKINLILSKDISQSNQGRSDNSQFQSLLNVFDVVMGNLDTDKLAFREDAYALYFEGILYEINGEYNDALISYKNAAKRYETSYAKQYALDKQIIQQAWFDTARMMKLEGGWGNELENLQKRLTIAQQARLKNLQRSHPETEIIIIQHIGEIPKRKELNFICYPNKPQRALRLRPIPFGTPKEKQNQQAWFAMLYSGKSPFDLIMGYTTGGAIGVLESLISKTFYLGPLWQMAEKNDLIESIEFMGLRVTVPYYPPSREPIKNTQVLVNSIEYPLITVESLGQIALQEQLKNAGSDLRGALAREAIKSIMTNAAGKAVDESSPISFLIHLAGQLTGMVLSGAETRQWQTLPYSIRITRIPIKPGKTTITLNTQFLDGSQQSVNHEFNLKSGEIGIWNPRTTSIP